MSWLDRLRRDHSAEASAAARADDQLIEHIRNGGDPDPNDDVAVLLAKLRDGEIQP